MRRRWKSIAALCMSAMIGCVLPVGTMMAAEEDTGLAEGVQEPEAELVEVTPQAAETTAETGVQEQSDKTSPVIVIRLQGTDKAQALGGRIEYDTYIGNRDQRLSISVEQGSAAALYYYLDTTANASDESKSEEQLADLWQTADRVNGQEISLGQDGRYVLYVKVETADGQTVCARSGGIVVDATAPVITGIDNGGTYPAGTRFGVTDDNLESVLINEQPAIPSSADGTYQVAAAGNSTSCVIRAKDKADNETVYSITVEGTEPDIRYIWVSGSYGLKAGRDYHLRYGSWTVDDDSTVYSGGITFYVKEDGQYEFDRK